MLTLLMAKCILAVHEAYWTCEGFWSRNLSSDLERGTLIGLGYNTALSGLGAEVPTYKQMQRLQGTVGVLPVWQDIFERV